MRVNARGIPEPRGLNHLALFQRLSAITGAPAGFFAALDGVKRVRSKWTDEIRYVRNQSVTGNEIDGISFHLNQRKRGVGDCPNRFREVIPVTRHSQSVEFNHGEPGKERHEREMVFAACAVCAGYRQCCRLLREAAGVHASVEI
jgi:hypothetical protein